MKCAFIFDLDGTICDAVPRYRKYIEDQGEDYENFYKHVEEDDEHFDVCCVLRALANAGFDILFVTGRREGTRDATLEWIESHLGADIANSSHLFMRSAEDGHRSDYVSKCRNYNTYIKDKWHVMGVFEDRDQCVRAWRDLGLRCYQVADGCY